MAAPPPNNCNPIPNGPFYSPPSWQICGTYLNYTVGCGICVSPEGDLESWKCGLGVIDIISGYGIQASPISNNVWQICNTGILDICGGEGVDSFGGQCTTLCLANSGVNPGVFLNPSIALDRFGRVTGVAERPPTIACCTIRAKGNLIVGLADDVGVALPVETNGSHLIVNCNCALGVQWATPAQSPFLSRCCYPSRGCMAIGTSTPDTPATFGTGANGYLLAVSKTSPPALTWVPPFAGNVSNDCSGGGVIPENTCCTVPVVFDFNNCGCMFYMIQVFGYNCFNFCDGSNEIEGWWQLAVRCASRPELVSCDIRQGFCLCHPAFDFNQKPQQTALNLLHPNFGATGCNLELSVCICSTILTPTVCFRYGASVFGF